MRLEPLSCSGVKARLLPPASLPVGVFGPALLLLLLLLLLLCLAPVCASLLARCDDDDEGGSVQGRAQQQGVKQNTNNLNLK